MAKHTCRFAHLLVYSMLSFCSAQAASLGLFESATDIGKIDLKGSSEFLADKATYRITGSGKNMWFNEDAGQFLSKKHTGDLVFSMDAGWEGAGKEAHRKACAMVRQTLDTDSPYVDVAVHGDGLIELQYRAEKGGTTFGLRTPVQAPATVKLERNGDVFTAFASKAGGPFQAIGTVSVALTDPVYVGLAVSAHNATNLETAVISHVSLQNRPATDGKPAAASLQPTLANVPYGKHPHQVLDFYQVKTNRLTPLLFFIHGGGWMVGDKANPDFLAKCLENGISVVSINYRFIPEAIADKVEPPVKGCLADSARALQFVRSKAAEWNIDKKRIGGCGGSAGGFTSLWLAFHPDLADAQSKDPIARESTRLSCVLAFVPQTSLDPVQMHEWIPNNDYGHHAFALPNMAEFIKQREKLLPLIKEFSPYELATADDPPVLLFYDSVPNLGQPFKDPPHSANFGAGIVPKLKQVGIEYEFNHTGAKDLKYPDLFSFLTAKLKKTPAAK